MSRRVTIGLHDGGGIVMLADGPEEAIPFDGFGELLCLKPGSGEEKTAEAELIRSNRMPESSHALRSMSLTT